MRKAKAQRRRTPYAVSGVDWRFLERHCPGIRAAWDRDVGIADAGLTIGISGTSKPRPGSGDVPLHAAAWTRNWTTTPREQRRHFTYTPETKTWREDAILPAPSATEAE